MICLSLKSLFQWFTLDILLTIATTCQLTLIKVLVDCRRRVRVKCKDLLTCSYKSIVCREIMSLQILSRVY